MSAARQAAKAQPRSLVKFARDRRRKACKVCALPAQILQQLKEAHAAKIQRAVQLEWLKEEHGRAITDSELTQHYSGRHDADE